MHSTEDEKPLAESTLTTLLTPCAGNFQLGNDIAAAPNEQAPPYHAVESEIPEDGAYTMPGRCAILHEAVVFHSYVTHLCYAASYLSLAG